MNTKQLIINPLEEKDIPVNYTAFAQAGGHRPDLLLENYFFQQNKGEREVFVAYLGTEFAGYVTIKWKSDYPPFAEKGTPEIVDLNVMPPLQRLHVASALLDKAEEVIFKRSAVAGIGVGLFSDYGPAQRLYALRGYVPDALGIAYKGKPVTRLQEVPIDDALVLYLTRAGKS